MPTKKYEDKGDCKKLRNLIQTETNNQWKQFCEETEEEVLEVYGVEEGRRGLFEGRGDEPQWIFKKEDNNNVKEGSREKKQTGEQCWRRLASWLRAFKQRSKSLRSRSEDERKA